MRAWQWLGASAIVLSATLAIAQDAPESLLPPGFDDPAPRPSPTPAPRPSAAPAPSAPTPSTGGTPVVQPIPSGSSQPSAAPVPSLDTSELSRLPSLDALENMSPDDLDELLGLKPKFDIPPAARRSMASVGVLAPQEGGLPTGSLANQPAALVRAALAGTKAQTVSRWGHILLRRALASRLAAPKGMNPVEFAALRVGVLNRIGEYGAARAVAQDVDTSNWNDSLTNHAIDAYIGTADIVGACPAVRLQGGKREDAQWKMLQAICNAYAGEGALAGTQLDRALRQGIAPRIDVLLAQRYAGAAGRGRRAVTIEWDGVEKLNPWTFALANAVGEEVPASLVDDAGPYYNRVRAAAPMLPLTQRVSGADVAAREGILSASAMVDLYSQIYSEDAIEGPAAVTASRLREAYVGDPSARWSAIKDIWGGEGPTDYGMSVLTAYAAARLKPDSAFEVGAAELIASMLAAGLDRDAMAWSGVVPEGSEAWGLLALANPKASGVVESGAVDEFIDNDGSADQRKSQFLLAGLAGLGRIGSGDLGDFSSRVEIDLTRQTRWTRAIARAGAVDNAAMVAILAGLGMQGSSWERMTALHLYHIVSALNAAGLEAEARMIAAEAVARA